MSIYSLPHQYVAYLVFFSGSKTLVQGFRKVSAFARFTWTLISEGCNLLGLQARGFFDSVVA